MILLLPKSKTRIVREPLIDDAFDIFQLIRHKVVNCNESWDILCTGAKGVGKSSTMLSVACLLDPVYSLKRWAFTTEEQTNMRANARKGNVIVSDEMGTQAALSSHNWQDKQSKNAVDQHQLDRTERIINIGTTLDIGRINNRVRTQYKVIINIEDKLDDNQTHGHGLGTSCVIRFVEEDPFATSDNDMFKRKYFRDKFGRRISRVIIPHPPIEMFRKYSVMRDDFKRKLKEKPKAKNEKEEENYIEKISRLNAQYTSQ